jgi:uncharacterized protein YciI
MFYDLAEGALPLAQQHFPAHRKRIEEFHERGLMLLVGTWGDEPVGAMAVFTTREAAEEFIAEDPFIVNGVVGSHHIRPWDEILQPS